LRVQVLQNIGVRMPVCHALTVIIDLPGRERRLRILPSGQRAGILEFNPLDDFWHAVSPILLALFLLGCLRNVVIGCCQTNANQFQFSSNLNLLGCATR
jgi:hypothetical protein